MTVNELAEKFGIEGAVKFQAQRNGLTRMDILAETGEATVYLQGAHVASWRPAGQSPVLWMSKNSWFQPGKPIRGGVPICFPWFGPNEQHPDSPNHGFARTLEWEVESTAKNDDGTVTACLLLKASEATKPFAKYWPAANHFELRQTVTVGKTLTMALQASNTGDEAMTFTEALHTYLAVNDVREISIDGLAETEYVSKVEGVRTTQAERAIRFAEETDRVYLNTPATCKLADPGAGREIIVEKSGSQSTVIWNPWTDKAAAMADYDDNEWPTMACIETANALDNTVTVQPGQHHTITATISTRPLG